MTTYQQFLESKYQLGGRHGFKPVWMPDFLFDFQKHLVEWNLEIGRSATFADCGLGKTPIELVWSENVVRHTNKPVIIFTPLAVAPQFVSEGEKFGVECQQSKDGKFTKKIVVANYERIHYFDPNDFTAAVCDESAVLKNFDGVTKAKVTEFMRRLPYRLLGTATPAPNDFIELGTSSEAIGEMGYMDMLSRFFKNDQNSNHPNRVWGNGKWRFRGHAERDFWRWVCSWARAIRKPSDLGFDDGPFILPKLITEQHIVESSKAREGFLFAMDAVGLHEQRAERRLTMQERCEKAASLVTNHPGPSIAWCHLNPEGDLLEELIPDCVQVAGADSIEKKEESLAAFQRGEIPNLVTKPDIAGFGLNFQHCAHQTYFPSHSFEQYYQGVRRSWRFGQTKSVHIDIVTSTGETEVLKNLTRKSHNAETMISKLVELMRNELRIEKPNPFTKEMKKPSFL